MENGFNFTTVDVLDALAKLIFKCTISSKLTMTKEYEELAATGNNKDSCRIKITYYVNPNYKNVYESILNNYGYNIGEHFIGLKTFVEQLAIVYSVYASG